MTGRKILVADDSVTIQKVIKLALSHEGYEIFTAAGGNEAKRILEEVKPDVALVDVSLPEINAYDLKKTPGSESTKFIVLYSAFEKLDDVRSKEVGFEGQLIKPFDPSGLRKQLQDLLAAPAEPQTAPTPPPPPIEASGSFEIPIPPSDRTKRLDTNVPPPSVPPKPFQQADSGAEEEQPMVIPKPRHAPKELLNATKPQVLPFPGQTKAVYQTSGLPPLFPSDEKDETLASSSTNQDSLGKGLSDPIPLYDQVAQQLAASTFSSSSNEESRSAADPLGGWMMDDQRKKLDPRVKQGPPRVKVPTPSAEDFVERPFITPPPPTSGVYSGAGATASFSQAELESMIRKNLEEALQKVLAENLPTLAENVIKKEIDRLVNEI